MTCYILHKWVRWSVYTPVINGSICLVGRKASLECHSPSSVRSTHSAGRALVNAFADIEDQVRG